MSTTLSVEGMSCEGCEDIVEDALAEVSGVESVEADEAAGTAVVEGEADHSALKDAVDYAGYEADLDSTGSEPEETADEG